MTSVALIGSLVASAAHADPGAGDPQQRGAGAARPAAPPVVQQQVRPAQAPSPAPQVQVQQHQFTPQPQQQIQQQRPVVQQAPQVQQQHQQFTPPAQNVTPPRVASPQAPNIQQQQQIQRQQGFPQAGGQPENRGGGQPEGRSGEPQGQQQGQQQFRQGPPAAQQQVPPPGERPGQVPQGRQGFPGQGQQGRPPGFPPGDSGRVPPPPGQRPGGFGPGQGGPGGRPGGFAGDRGGMVHMQQVGHVQGPHGFENFDHPTHTLARPPMLRQGGFDPRGGWGRFQGRPPVWGHRPDGRPVFIFVDPYVFNPFWPTPWGLGGMYYGWGWNVGIGFGWGWNNGYINAPFGAWNSYLYDQYMLPPEYGYLPYGQVALPQAGFTQFDTVQLDQCGATQIALYDSAGQAFIDHVIVNSQDPESGATYSQDIDVRTGLNPYAFTQFIPLDNPDACVTDVTVVGQSVGPIQAQVQIEAVVPQ